MAFRLNIICIICIFIVAFATVGCSNSTGTIDSYGDDQQNTKLVVPIKRIRRGVENPIYVLPNGRFPYNFTESVIADQNIMNIINEAISLWQSETCIFFTDKPKDKEVVINFHYYPNGGICVTNQVQHWEGDQTENGTIINERSSITSRDIHLGPECNLRSVAHEIAHALGVSHEVSRPDRNEYVYVNSNNIQEGASSQFDVVNKGETYGIEYDYTSNLHYEQWAGAITKRNYVLVAKDPRYQRFLRHGYLPSYRDIHLVNKMYQCDSKCPKLDCHDGHIRQTNVNSGGQCSCKCPPNTSGYLCEKKIRDDYYEQPPCGGTMNTPGTISIPEGPNGRDCVWQIETADDNIISVTFENFNLLPRMGEDHCYHESLELRYGNKRYDGEIYCGFELNQQIKYSFTGKFDIILQSREDNDSRPTFKANVEIFKIKQ